MPILNKERDHIKLGKAHELFFIYPEQYLRKFYAEFCKAETTLDYIEIKGQEITFHAGKRNGLIYVHDLNALLKSYDIVVSSGGISTCRKIRDLAGKWLHPRFLQAVKDVEKCEDLL